MPGRRSLRLRIFLFFALIAAGGIAALAGGLTLGYLRAGEPAALQGFLTGGLVAAFVLTGLVTWIWLLFDENVARPVERLAADLRAHTHAGSGKAAGGVRARHLGDLAPAVAETAASLAEARNGLVEAVARETARIAGENARLVAILRGVPTGVILCTSTHRIALFNERAADLLGDCGEMGLDRPLFGVLREGPIRHARDRLARPGRNGAVDLLCATAQGGRLLQGQMRLLEQEEAAASGYVLTLRDVTADMAAHSERERLLHDMIEELRRPTAGIATALEVMAEPDLPPEGRMRLGEAVAAEAADLVASISEIGRRVEAADSHAWPMGDVPAADIADALRAALESHGGRLDAQTEPLVLRCDAFAVAQLLTGAALNLAPPACDLRLDITADGDGAVIDLGWDGPPPPVQRLDAWLASPLPGGGAAYRGRDVLDGHATEFWPERAAAGTRLRLPIRRARPEAGRAVVAARPEFYDFGLLADAALIADERPLDRLPYVVFDTETTGLLPSQDKIVQIAAVRVVGGRLLEGEYLDLLVDPGRPIPAAATRVHRITDAMVAGAPSIAEAGRRLHAFCGDAVIVAHNAPFDMAFLRRHQAAIGARFENPILDTVLLSAMLYGNGADHSLDAIADRLGIRIAPEARHTAMGDAEATARILLRMLPMLRAAGFVTLGETVRAFARHSRLVRSA
jgi:DNA polymerase III subunit epsilon